jgi:hypothetical protein
MTGSSDDEANKSATAARKPMFPISAYANRIRLKAKPESSDSESAKIMFDILVKWKIRPSKAYDAVLEALDAAADHRLAKSRFENRQAAQKFEIGRVDELISIFERLTDAISKLPPSAKAKLNVRMAEVTKEGVADTEIFIELMNCVGACLPELSPEKLAEDALAVLRPKGASEQTWPIIALWESIPPHTRTEVERNLEKRLGRSGIELLRLFPALLDEFRPTIRLGAPQSIQFAFARQVERIWRKLGLKCGRQYNCNSQRHVPSPFIRFANAALDAVEVEGAISDRQVSNLKGAPALRVRRNGRAKNKPKRDGDSRVQNPRGRAW